jgi:hypothetical protein
MVRVGRGIRYILAWLASTAVAVALSWLGVKSVLEAGAPQRPQVVAGPTLVTSTVGTTTTPSSVPPTSLPSSSSASSSTSSSPSATRLASADGSWSEENGKSVYLRSFQLDGGELAVKFSDTGVEPISATPRQGFAVSITQPNNALVVEFKSATETSRLEANWDNGPRWKIIESG